MSFSYYLFGNLHVNALLINALFHFCKILIKSLKLAKMLTETEPSSFL